MYTATRRQKKSVSQKKEVTGDVELSPMADPERVVAILLSDGWHQVEQDSFTVTAYSWGTGASWMESDTGVEIKCRMRAIQAIMQRPNGKA